MMTRALIAIVALVGLVGCGEKIKQMKDAANAVSEIAKNAEKAKDATDEAEKFQAERRAKGDTVAMSYEDLQKFLPSAPGGYQVSGEPSGSSQTMTGFSMSQAEQEYSKPAGEDGNAPTVSVKIVDFGGSQMAYGLMALPMMMNLSQEDAHHRMKTITMNTPYSWASEEYDKDNKDSKVTVVTRYRYIITVEASNQSDDQTDMVKSLADDIASKFEGK
jgi:hypothetical protein